MTLVIATATAHARVTQLGLPPAALMIVSGLVAVLGLALALDLVHVLRQPDDETLVP